MKIDFRLVSFRRSAAISARTCGSYFGLSFPQLPIILTAAGSVIGWACRWRSIRLRKAIVGRRRRLSLPPPIERRERRVRERPAAIDPRRRVVLNEQAAQWTCVVGLRAQKAQS